MDQHYHHHQQQHQEHLYHTNNSNNSNNNSHCCNDPTIMNATVAALLLAPRAAAVTIGRAGEKNNEGAAYFEQGDLTKSYLCFREALEILNGEASTLMDRYTMELSCLFPQLIQPMTSFQEIQTNSTLTQQIRSIVQQSNQTPPKWLKSSFHPPQQGSGVPSPPPSTTTHQHQHHHHDHHMSPQESTFFLYWKPFRFTTTAGTENVSRESLALHKGQVMFNLAMVMHKGENCTSMKGSVQTALKLYDMCLEYSIYYRGVLNNTNNHGWLLLTIASLNNKAHVFHEFCEPNKLLDVLNALFLCLGYLPQEQRLVNENDGTVNYLRGGYITTTSIMDHTDLQGILFNVYMLRELPCARAA